MTFKRWSMVWLFVVTGFILAGCNKSAPELSFEETLQVYAKQNEVIKEVAQFMNDPQALIQSNLKLKTSFDGEELAKGNFTLDAQSIADNQTKNSESQLAISLAGEGASPLSGWIGKINVAVNLNTILKDYQIFLKLADLNLETEQQEAAGMVAAMAEGFKGKRFMIDNPQLKEILKASGKESFNLRENDKLYEVNSDLYTGITSTKYDGQPAWKVDFNTEEIKKMALDIYDLSQSGNTALLSGNEEVLVQQQEIRAEFEKMVNELKFENVDAYFVIRSADRVDFVLKNTDIILQNIKMKMSQIVEDDTTTMEVLVSPQELSGSEQELSESLKLTITLVKTRTGNYNFKIAVDTIGGDEKSEMIAKIEGTVKAALSDKALSIQPQFELSIDDLKINVEADFSAKKIKEHTFETPQDAQSLEELLGSFMGTPALQDLSEDEFSGDFIEMTGNIELPATWTGSIQ